MKRVLITLIAFICVSMSMQVEAATVTKSTWMQNNSSYATQNVAEIYLANSGELADALQQLQDEEYVFQYLHLSTDNGFTFSDADLQALSGLNVETIEMQHVHTTSAFTFSNSNVKYFILPYNWNRTEVKAFADANINSANFKACYSTSNTENDGDATLIAYLNEANTLRDAINHSYYDTNDYKTLGSGGINCSRLRVLRIMGNVSARDISRTGIYDENGHYVLNGDPDENSQDFNKNTSGNDWYGGYNNESMDGALNQCYTLNVIDLRGAYVPDEYCADIVVPFNNIKAISTLRELWMPDDPRFKTVPAYYLHVSTGLRQICIPGNIENIRTKAFAGSTLINYVWTTGPDANTRYDNGAAFVTGSGDNAATTWKFMNNNAEGNVAMAESDWSKFQYGTITLPANLKLIERYAFASSTSVSDVYVLNPIAPECHVDAFNTTMYVGNNTLQTKYIQDGIVTREAYRNDASGTEYKLVAILHYPRETTDPHIQRYTDPTREYSIATGERDGNGSTIYYPNHSEMSYAYLQGSFGYLWKGWNDSRNWYDQSLKLGYGSSMPLDKASHQNGDSAPQASANQYWIDNDADADVKADRSFYDVTTGGNNQFGETPAPSGLTPYYQNRYVGYDGALYPQPETKVVTDENGNPVMVTVPVRDANGDIEYDPADTYEGNYVRSEYDKYVEATDGLYCHPLTQDDNNGQWLLKYEYTKNDNGAWVQAPWDATGNTWTDYKDYMANQYPGIQRWDRNAIGFKRFTDQWEEKPRFNIGEDYVLYDSFDNEYKYLLTRYNKVVGYNYTAATSSDAGPFWKMKTEEVEKTVVTKLNDYRGWHQFILNGRAYMSLVPMEPLRSFITDNDWWTICEPYDLRYSDLIKFFGYDRAGFDKKIPYLSKLMYVIRDVENQKITLMFSKNLMEYKEQFVEADGTLTGKEQFVETNGKSSGRVHGFVDDEKKWTPEELDKDPVILHAGVPYLIRPNLVFEEGKAQRQFDILKSSNEDLYNRLKYSEDLPGDKQMEFVHNGIYTVPAFVVGYNSADAVIEGTIDSGEKVIEMKDGTKFTYKDSEHGGKKLKYKGKDVDYRISSDYTYSFVGTFYKSVIPQYSYFLGWDSNANRATFWYSAQQDKTGWNWNNETGIICPNFVNLTAEQQKVHKATKVDDPARWTLVTQAGASLLGSDDFSTASSAKSYDMESDGISMVGDSEVTGIEEIVPATTESETVSVYNVNGVFMGNSVEGLAKGIYIVNGKKYVVK